MQSLEFAHLTFLLVLVQYSYNIHPFFNFVMAMLILSCFMLEECDLISILVLFEITVKRVHYYLKSLQTLDFKILPRL